MGVGSPPTPACSRILRVRSLEASILPYATVPGFEVDWHEVGIMASVSRDGADPFFDADPGRGLEWLTAVSSEGPDEAGLGNLDEGQPAGAAVPGGNCDSPYISQTQVVNHSGVSATRPGTTCKEVPDAEEECVNRKLQTDARGYGPTMGAFTLTNNCQTWVNDVLAGCKKKCDPAPPPALPPFIFFVPIP